MWEIQALSSMAVIFSYFVHTVEYAKFTTSNFHKFEVQGIFTTSNFHIL